MKNLHRKLCFTFLFALSVLFFNASYAEDNTPKFDCTLTDQVSDDGSTGDAKDTFTPDTLKIYLVCHADKITAGQTLKSVWIAADTGGVAPDNYKIDEKEVTVSADAANQDGGDANFSLSKPTNGWPTGSYHVDLYSDGVLDQSVKFTVK